MKTLLISLMLAAVVQAADAPTLTLEQKQNLVILSQRVELDLAKIQLLQADVDKARADFNAAVKALEKPGYTLDLPTLTYVTKPEKAEQP